MSGRGPLRQSQVIAPFGPGAMHTDRFGTTLICCGLDHWFDESDFNSLKEFIIDDEWRLNRDLGVNHLRRPPDHRRSMPGIEVPNTGMIIPYLRFPTWHYCIGCGHMDKSSLTYQGLKNQNICSKCYEKRGRKIPLVQVRFVAVCEHGHIQEFPWNEWAHQSLAPECGDDKLRLREYGGGTLDSIEISCECGKSRRLSGITSPDLNINGVKFECGGQRLWLHDEDGTGCGLPIRGALRNASNLYFAKTFSSIFLPRLAQTEKINPEITELLHVLDRPNINARLDTLLQVSASSLKIIELLREKHEADFKEYSNQELLTALTYYINAQKEQEHQQPSVKDSFNPVSFRYEEYLALKQELDEPFLMSKKADLKEYSRHISEFFSCIMLVQKLRETKVFTGFTRINPESAQSSAELRNNLWLEPPDPAKSWLPASIVHGEGLFFEFNQELLTAWVEGPKNSLIKKRIEGMEKNLIRATSDIPGYKISNELHPVFVMIHTFVHLLINQLTFECGYSSASLRERLYYSSEPEKQMAGLLIYTAAGDSEGTMGGLVRMGKPGMLEPLLKQALKKAQWCSADPVCMELGVHGGQGPYSCNLAACHNCALVPETSCEEFNRFLDRGVVTGTTEDRDLGFFNTLLEKYSRTK